MEKFPAKAACGMLRRVVIGPNQYKIINYQSFFSAVFGINFAIDTQLQRRAFTLLKRAYVDARYKKSYRITKKQLECLAEWVRKLQRPTKYICREKIESFI